MQVSLHLRKFQCHVNKCAACDQNLMVLFLLYYYCLPYSHKQCMIFWGRGIKLWFILDIFLMLIMWSMYDVSFFFVGGGRLYKVQGGLVPPAPLFAMCLCYLPFQKSDKIAIRFSILNYAVINIFIGYCTVLNIYLVICLTGISKNMAK